MLPFQLSQNGFPYFRFSQQHSKLFGSFAKELRKVHLTKASVQNLHAPIFQIIINITNPGFLIIRKIPGCNGSTSSIDKQLSVAHFLLCENRGFRILGVSYDSFYFESVSVEILQKNYNTSEQRIQGWLISLATRLSGSGTNAEVNLFQK